MTDTREPRPTDLVALVTFDDEVRENQAVTRERLGHPAGAPTPLSAAVAQWLHLGRRTWVHVAGREIRGIATARELASRHAWEIDTLIDAGDASQPDVIEDLLQQALVAARDAEATHVLLRVPVDVPAVQDALRAGFRPVVTERLWRGAISPASRAESVRVRDWTDADAFPSFQVYNHALPVDARSNLAMTLEEWQAVHDRHWQERGGTLVAELDGRLMGVARHARQSGQFTLQVEPGAGDVADALIAGVQRRMPEARDHVALIPEVAETESGALERAGLEPVADFALLCKRINRPVRDRAYARAGAIITGG